MSLLCVLKAVVAWVILMLVGSNLIGLVVRGLLWAPPPVDLSPDNPARELLSSEVKGMRTGNTVITFISIAIAGAYLFALFYFWNAMLAIVAGLLMTSRLPDLLWEMRTGRKVTSRDRPKGTIYMLATIIIWAALPSIWYALCW